MVELDVPFVHTTGTAGRTQGAHKEAGKSFRIREAPFKGGDVGVHLCNSCA